MPYMIDRQYKLSAYLFILSIKSTFPQQKSDPSHFYCMKYRNRLPRNEKIGYYWQSRILIYL